MMTSLATGTNHKKSRSTTEKMALTAGSLSAIYLLPGMAYGSVIYTSGSPVSLDMSAPHGTEVTWDVDGNGSQEFSFKRRDFNYSGLGKYDDILFRSANFQGDFNGRGIVADPTDPSVPFVRALNPSFIVGPNPAAYDWVRQGSEGFQALKRFSKYTSTNQQVLTSVGIGLNFGPGNFEEGDNYLGFRFVDANDMMHYGWATINFDLASEKVSINNWAYETIVDTAIRVGDQGFPDNNVPEPSSLALLALGAGGLMAIRRRRQLNS